MDISTFYAVTSATCFALVGLWWSVVKDKPEWFKGEAKKRMAGGVYASFLIPGVMSLAAETPPVERFGPVREPDGVGIHDRQFLKIQSKSTKGERL